MEKDFATQYKEMSRREILKGGEHRCCNAGEHEYSDGGSSMQQIGDCGDGARGTSFVQGSCLLASGYHQGFTLADTG
jgi:hypothetical protein